MIKPHHFSPPQPALILAVLASLLALGTAYTSQLAFGLKPCHLCLLQRLPFMIVIVLGVGGLALRRKPELSYIAILLSVLAFLAGAVLAAYHSGIERHWWQSALEGCLVDFGDSKAADAQSLLAQILTTPAARCDDIPWADPLFGLSMANYNAVYCLALAGLCLAAYCSRPRRDF